MKLLGALFLVCALLLAPSALARPDLPVGTECDGSNACVVVRTGDLVCAGVGFGLQGVGACYRVSTSCAYVILGPYQDVCVGPMP